ncbi:hypothetical protein KRP22_011735 [Phytophthora ramorum]|uniref:Uncharacterized protein n=1 Tax=Phytophthora ramorum TaxID=164328 RepID=H3GKB3_PHYRM|nr:Protein REVEILLE 8 [Phytophthora ramorum]KAH7498425.1 Protein REVEILLE 8 [Phytophthora ramorum]KAH7499296.1 Protein REVEILLE 8 [Phytophthora ramorum]
MPESSRNPTWDEYLTTSSNGSFELAFPATFETPRPMQSPYASTSPSYSARAGPPPPRRLSPAPMRVTPTTDKRKASPVPSLASYPPSPPVMTFPTSAMSPGSDMTSVAMKPSRSPATPAATQVGRWTKREHELFLEGLQRFGKSWKKISSLVHTRTLVQIRTHAQKYLQKQSRAAIKADAKAAGTAGPCKPETRPKTQHQQAQPPSARGQPTLQMNAPRVAVVTPRPWKAGDRNSGFAPLAFPSSLSSSASMDSSSHTTVTLPRAAFQVNAVSRLDQLLQDDNSIPAFVDEYYTSPTAIEDDLLRPLYTNEAQWVPRLALPAPANYSNKRRRVETSVSTAPTSTSVAVPVLRPAFSGAAFEPLPAPNNSSPRTSPSAYTPRQSAAATALLAAHETDETTNYTNAWL